MMLLFVDGLVLLMMGEVEDIGSYSGDSVLLFLRLVELLSLEFVHKLLQSGYVHVQSFPLSDLPYNIVGFASFFKGVVGEDFPMIKRALRECLSASLAS